MDNGYYLKDGEKPGPDRIEEIVGRVEHVAQMQQDGESPEVIYAMTRFWAKWDEVRGYKRPRRADSD